MRVGFAVQVEYWICDRGTQGGLLAALHRIEL